MTELVLAKRNWAICYFTYGQQLLKEIMKVCGTTLLLSYVICSSLPKIETIAQSSQG